MTPRLGEDPSVYLQLAAAPIDADIFDEQTGSTAMRRSANSSISTNSGAGGAGETAAELPRKFQNLRLNMRIDAHAQFISDPDWMECAAPIDMAELAGKPCYAGLDLSQTTRHACVGSVLAAQRRGAAVFLAAGRRAA